MRFDQFDAVDVCDQDRYGPVLAAVSVEEQRTEDVYPKIEEKIPCASIGEGVDF
jgi:hypothetical protein